MTKLFAIFALLSYFVKEVILSNLAVARDVLRRRPQIRPEITTLRLGPLTNRQAFVLTNMVTMTPGTLSIELSNDLSQLTVHTLYGYQIDTLKRSIERSYEPLIRNAL